MNLGSQDSGNNETLVWDSGSYYKMKKVCTICNDTYLLQGDGSCMFVGYKTVNCGPGCASCVWNSQYEATNCTACMSNLPSLIIHEDSLTGLYSCIVNPAQVIPHCSDNWVDASNNVICRKCMNESFQFNANKTQCVFISIQNCSPGQYFDRVLHICTRCPAKC